MTALVIYLVLLDACVHPAGSPPRRPTRPVAWTLPVEASDSEWFCAQIERSPAMLPWETGLRCVQVLTLRHWIAGLRAGN